jgi:hypothetical protein
MSPISQRFALGADGKIDSITLTRHLVQHRFTGLQVRLSAANVRRCTDCRSPRSSAARYRIRDASERLLLADIVDKVRGYRSFVALRHVSDLSGRSGVRHLWPRGQRLRGYRGLEPSYRPQAGQASQVLGGGGKQELVSCAVWAPQTQARELKNSLEVSKQHLNLFSKTTGGLVFRR